MSASDASRRRAQKNKVKRLLTRVQEVLLRDWDPIGVADQPLVRGEYDEYATRVCSRLLDGSSTPDEIAVYLAHIEGETMELQPPNREAIDRTVDALMRLKREFSEP